TGVEKRDLPLSTEALMIPSTAKVEVLESSAGSGPGFRRNAVSAVTSPTDISFSVSGESLSASQALASARDTLPSASVSQLSVPAATLNPLGAITVINDSVDWIPKWVLLAPATVLRMLEMDPCVELAKVSPLGLVQKGLGASTPTVKLAGVVQ